MNELESEKTMPPDAFADLERAIELVMTGESDPEFELRIPTSREVSGKKFLRNTGYLTSACRPSVPCATAMRNEVRLGLLHRVQVGRYRNAFRQSAGPPRRIPQESTPTFRS